MKIVINNEAEAWGLLERAINGEKFPDDVQLVFEGWPVFQMGVQGKDWDSTVPTRVMAPLLDVQKDINRAYANVRYGVTNLRKLQDDERDDLEVVIKVKKGSSLFDADLWKQLSTIAEAAVGRMDGTQIVVTVLGLGLLFTAPVMYKAWLASRQKEKELDNQIAMSKQETERMKVFADAMKMQPVLAVASEDVDATQNRLLKVAKPGDLLGIKEVNVTAADAEVLAKPERARAEDVNLEGQFYVLGNRTDMSEGFRITVRRSSDNLTVKADVPIELPDEQKILIQDAEWRKTPIVLSMNASMLRGVISQAVVVSASKIKLTRAEPTDGATNGSEL